MQQVTKDMIDCWRANYGLDKRSPEDAVAEAHKQWSDAITPEMPADFKDWHDTPAIARPEIAAWSIRNLRERLRETEAEMERLRTENAALKHDLQYARDGLTEGRTRMREDNERLRAALLDARDCRTCRNFTTRSGGCVSVLRCVDGSGYQRQGRFQYWEAAPLGTKARKLLAWLQRSKDGMLLESQIVGYVHENMDRYMSVAVFEAWATQRATAAERDQWRPVTWADGQGNEAIDLRQPRERQMLARVTDLLAARLGTNADEWKEVSEAREVLDGPPTAPPVGPTAVGPAA